MERIAKFEAICRDLQEAHQAEIMVPEVVAAATTDETLLSFDDAND